MSRFFINRPIVAMVISILTVIVGLVSLASLPVAQFPNIVPPEARITTTFVGADAQTVEQSVATPIEQQLSGVDNLNYMYSINGSDGSLRETADFDVATDPNTDLILTQMRVTQAAPQLPAAVNTYGVTVQKQLTAPLMIVSLFSPHGTYDSTFLANYAYININDELTRVRGIASVTVFGAGQYALRYWVKPDQLAKLGITVGDIVAAINAQNTVNPAGEIGAEPAPKGQEFTYSVRAQGRLSSPEQFARIIIRENPDGSVVRLGDVARVELGAQLYNVIGRLNGRAAALVAIYQLPGSNALDDAKGVRAAMARLKQRFPADLDYIVALDTTRSVSEGVVEISHTLWEALLLVVLVVFVFLQGWRPTLIPILAVPVSLIGTFALFPLFGFSVNTLSLFGLVLAIGLVVDDAIVVVEAVEHHIEQGMEPRDATLKAMSEVAAPVMAIAIILAAVFIPTAFIPGITGRLYQQFALTIAISVIISAFNALSLSPALCALVLKPRPKKDPESARGFYGWFNRTFGRARRRYVSVSRTLIHKSAFSLLLLAGFAFAAVMLGERLPKSFLPDEDQGYMYIQLQLPNSASLQRTAAAASEVEKVVLHTPGVQTCTSVIGFSLLSTVYSTYNSFFFVTFKPWSQRSNASEKYAAIKAHLAAALRRIPEGQCLTFPPPAIPGIGTAGGFTFVLEDRAGRDISFLASNLRKFMAAAAKRKELANMASTFTPTVPQLFVHVDRDKVLKQGVALADVYQTLQCFLGGTFVNYFNRFGRQWQVYVGAEPQYRSRADQIGSYYVRNRNGDMVPLSAFTTVEKTLGPEFTMRYNLYRSAQINGAAAPGYSSEQATDALEQVFAQTMPKEMGYDYIGMSYQEKAAAKGVPPAAIFGLSLVFVFLILAALYESWSLPFSVLLGVPIAVFGAYLFLHLRSMENNVFAQIGLIMLIGLSAKNAILIVEFARTRFEHGESLIDAALEGAEVRLRPILMTSFAFIFGCLPLWFASGAGGVAREVMGTAVIGGMLAASVLAIFLVPVTFYVVERLAGGEAKRDRRKARLEATEGGQ
ncbi:MAG TPA: multidrug efflux RND transporter permease subunit [Opitutaceae bacterium]|jgi:HAE1 family hydrophobic/amphiphilic exporter-1|nr:multidrug efflux RND transporter permease subunit [Opitutaceae bacterium]